MMKQTEPGISFLRFPSPYTMEDSARYIREAGFRHAMLWWWDDMLQAGYTQPVPAAAGRYQQLALLRDAGIDVCFLHAHSDIPASAFWEEGEAGDRLVQSLLHSVEECSDVKVNVMVVHLISGDKPPDPNQAGLDRIGLLARRAEELGVVVAVENTKRAAHVDYVLNNIRSSGLGFCYDSGHDYLYNAEPYAILRRHGNRLAAVHLHDNEGGKAMRWKERHRDAHAIPGEGNIDWSIVKAGLDAVGYTGVRLIEVEANTAAPGETPQTFLKRAYHSTGQVL